jgi:hypothetical protein
MLLIVCNRFENFHNNCYSVCVMKTVCVFQKKEAKKSISWNQTHILNRPRFVRWYVEMELSCLIYVHYILCSLFIASESVCVCVCECWQLLSLSSLSLSVDVRRRGWTRKLFMWEVLWEVCPLCGSITSLWAVSWLCLSSITRNTPKREKHVSFSSRKLVQTPFAELNSFKCFMNHCV